MNGGRRMAGMVWGMLGIGLGTAAWGGAQEPSRAPLYEPAVSPDGREIAFIAGGDVWTVPASGGTAQLLVAHPATEFRPLYSPDGRYLVFSSLRSGNGDLYRLTLATGALLRLTWDDASELPDGWSPDSRFVYFHSGREDIAGMNDVFRVRADGAVGAVGGMAVAVTADRYVNEFFSAPREDGTLAFSARGIASGQWWREGTSHIDSAEIWQRDPAGAYTKLTDGGGRDLWPMWDPAGTLYFVSDRGGSENLWALAPGAAEPTALTRFSDGRVLWPALAANGASLVFERGLSIWRYDVATGNAAPVPITLRGTGLARDFTRRTQSGDWSELALSPDGKKLALVARGEIFVVAAKDGGPATRVTRTAAVEYQPVWAPDSRRLAYTSERAGRREVYLYDFADGSEKRLAAGDTPRFSPDGESLALLVEGREVAVVTVATGAVRRVATGQFQAPPLHAPQPVAWSPDGKYLVYTPQGEGGFRNAWVVPAAGGEARQVSFLTELSGATVVWSPDGKFLLFDTGQRTEPSRLARVDLVPRAPRFREDQFRELFAAAPDKEKEKEKDKEKEPEKGKDKADAKPAPVEISFEHIRRRFSFVPVGYDIGLIALAPDGKQVAVTATVAGRDNVYVYSLDELSTDPPVAKQLTATSGGKGSLQYGPNGEELFFLDGGSVKAVKASGGDPRTIAVSADLESDFLAEREAVFEQAWAYLRDNFYDAGMHGVDWSAARERYLPWGRAAATPDELRRVIALMIGELDASHTGISRPGSENVTLTGRLGLRFDREVMDRLGLLQVSEVVEFSPAALGGVTVGDYLLAVGGTPVSATVDLAAVLDGRIGKRTELRLSRNPDGAESRTAAVNPIDLSAEKRLLYRQWVEQKRRYVERVSNGRLGYVHLINMSSDALDQFHLDLDTENRGREGVVVDIRNNNGGFVHSYALDVLSRKPFLTFTFRGMEPVSARPVLGQRSLERPTVLVINQHSLSDAEDMTEGYRALGLGPIVGEPTAGWIIYTSNVTLLDGSSLRLPFIRVDDQQGKNMERASRPPDIAVERPIGESVGADRDRQLDAAVAALLERLPKKP